MRTVSLNEYLTLDNIWVRRILSFEPFETKRSLATVRKEYDFDKFSHLTQQTMEEVRKEDWRKNCKHITLGEEIIISIKDTFYRVPIFLADNLRIFFLKKYLEPYRSSSYCELGCGYGYNLFHIGGYGGDCSPNALKIGRRMGLDLMEFDFYKPSSYNFLKDNTTIFTHQAIEQLPDASCFMEGLLTQKDKIAYVVNFEEIYSEKKDLLSVFRRRYVELNDYNKNLLTLLRTNPMVEILRIEYDVISFNPLLSVGMIAWKFK